MRVSVTTTIFVRARTSAVPQTSRNQRGFRGCGKTSVFRGSELQSLCGNPKIFVGRGFRVCVTTTIFVRAVPQTSKNQRGFSR
jgi:hypothetical protein